MATFGQIAKGKRARKRITFPLLAGTSADGAADARVEVDLVVLTGIEEADVLAKARTFAKERGVDDPRDGQPIYDLAQWVHTLAIACVDPDSPEDAPRPFFEGGAAQILGSELLGRDVISYLYEHQQAWQDQVSPRARTIGPAELVAHVVEIAASEDPTPFLRLAPVLRWSLHRSMAVALLSSPMLKSLLSSDCEPDGTSSNRNSADATTTHRSESTITAA
jgi:hypothetical protein